VFLSIYKNKWRIPFRKRYIQKKVVGLTIEWVLPLLLFFYVFLSLQMKQMGKDINENDLNSGITIYT